MNNERLHYLDGLRGAAAMAVVLSHAIGIFGLPSYLQFVEDTPVRFFWHGEGAVLVFFILSGFVLSQYVNSKGIKLEFKPIVNYCVQRFNRIYPAYFIALIITFMIRKDLQHPLYFKDIFSSWIMSLLSFRPDFHDLIKEINIFRELAPQTRIIPQGWTLVFEMCVSLVIPFFVLIVKNSRLNSLIFALLAIKLLNLNPVIMPFIVGIIFSCEKTFFKRLFDRLSTPMKYWLMLAGILLFTSNFYFSESVLREMNSVFTSAILPGACILFFIVLHSTKLQKLLNTPVFQFLGTISYSLYLFHFTVMIVSLSLIDRFFITDGVPDTNLKLWSYVISLTLALAGSSIFYYVCEKSSMIWGRKIIDRFFTLR